MVLIGGKSITSLPQGYIRKIGEKVIHQFLIAFKNYKAFHESQRQDTWTKESCECLDYIRTIVIPHTTIPKQLERHATLYHSRYDPKQRKEDLERCPDYHQTTRAIETLKQVRFKNQKDVTITARIWIQRSSTGLCNSLT